jgi:hypothetical protein
MTYSQVAEVALNAALGAGRSNDSVVSLLYRNVVGVSPAAAESAYYKGLLLSGALTQSQLAISAAENSLNKVHVDMVGLGASGIEYL